MPSSSSLSYFTEISTVSCSFTGGTLNIYLKLWPLTSLKNSSAPGVPKNWKTGRAKTALKFMVPPLASLNPALISQVSEPSSIKNLERTVVSSKKSTLLVLVKTLVCSPSVSLLLTENLVLIFSERFPSVTY